MQREGFAETICLLPARAHCGGTAKRSPQLFNKRADDNKRGCRFFALPIGIFSGSGTFPASTRYFSRLGPAVFCLFPVYFFRFRTDFSRFGKKYSLASENIFCSSKNNFSLAFPASKIFFSSAKCDQRVSGKNVSLCQFFPITRENSKQTINGHKVGGKHESTNQQTSSDDHYHYHHHYDQANHKQPTTHKNQPTTNNQQPPTIHPPITQ